MRQGELSRVQLPISLPPRHLGSGYAVPIPMAEDPSISPFFLKLALVAFIAGSCSVLALLAEETPDLKRNTPVPAG